MDDHRVRRRCVLYLSGFDPKGAAHYHALYRDESAKQALTTGFEVAVGPRCKNAQGNPTWDVRAEDDGVVVETDYEFLRWDDVVRQHWPRQDWRVWRAVFLTTLHNLGSGALSRIRRLSWPPFAVLFVPFALLCAVLMGLPVLAWAVYSGVRVLGGAWLWALLSSAVVVAVCLWAAARLERRWSMLWLMRSYAFTLQQSRGQSPKLEARLDQHAQTLSDRVRSGKYDEVLLVGHSSGCIMAVIVMARALRLAPRLATPGVAVNLLTLGQWIPLLGVLPQAHRFRDELQSLSIVPGIGWVDFSAPPDGCCFALCDPIAGLGLQTADRLPGRPELRSPRFVKMFDPQAYTGLKRDKLRMHFQYLMAADRVSDYDYFRITAGSRPLVTPTSESRS